MPDRADAGWMSWLRDQRKKGVLVYLGSQCMVGPLHPELCEWALLLLLLPSTVPCVQAAGGKEVCWLCMR